MAIWKNEASLEFLELSGNNTMEHHLGIKFLEIGEDYLKASMPVDHRTCQPYRLLHGGASVVLAETLGSTAAALCLDSTKHYPVGVEINANHLRSAKEGDTVIGICKPLKIGRTLHVWNIEIYNGELLICSSRLTVAIRNF